MLRYIAFVGYTVIFVGIGRNNVPENRHEVLEEININKVGIFRNAAEGRREERGRGRVLQDPKV